MNAIITGAGRGIGASIALELARQKMNICICSRNEEELRSVCAEAMKDGVQATYLAVDLSRKEEVLKFADFCLQNVPTIDILINNAGAFVPGNVSDEKDGLLEDMLNINLFSAYHLTRRILPSMKERNQGLILNISSVAGLQAYPMGGSYSISKFALTGFSKNLRKELSGTDIKVSTIYPGAVYTQSWENSDIEPERIMEARDIAKMVSSLTHLSPRAVAEEIILRPQHGDL